MSAFSIAMLYLILFIRKELVIENTSQMCFNISSLLATIDIGLKTGSIKVCIILCVVHLMAVILHSWYFVTN